MTKIKTYELYFKGFNNCVTTEIDDVLEDMRVFLLEDPPGSEVTIKITQYTKEELDDMQEFEGY